MAVGPKDGDGDGAGEEHRTEVPYQVTRWSNTYSGAGGGMSSQWNWDDRPRSRGCTWVYEIVGKLKCPKADTRERQVGVASSCSGRRNNFHPIPRFILSGAPVNKEGN